jgi:hypothetical protein
LYFVTGAWTKSWWLSRASRWLAGFWSELNGAEQSTAALFRRRLRSGVKWSVRKPASQRTTSGKCLGDSCRAFKMSLSVGVGGASRVRRKDRRLDKLRGGEFGWRKSRGTGRSDLSCEARVAVWAALADRRCFFAVHTARARGLPTWNGVRKQMGARGG